MIDRDLFHQLGWADELIDAVNRVATPMSAQAAEINDESMAAMKEMRSISSNAIYSDAVTNNTSSGVTFELVEKTDKQ